MDVCKKCGNPIYSLVYYVNGDKYHEPCANMVRSSKKDSSEISSAEIIKEKNTDSVINGTIKWFSNEKRFGFILDPDGNEYFFHISNVLGAKLPGNGDSVKFRPYEGRKGKPAATDVEITTHNSVHSRRPYYGKNVQRTEVIEHGNSKFGSAARFGAMGAFMGGPIGGLIGAVLGGALSEDKDKVTKQVDITSPCIRCGDNGHVTSRVDERTGFQCPTCNSFWKVPDYKLPPEDLAALKEIDFTKK